MTIPVITDYSYQDASLALRMTAPQKGSIVSDVYRLSFPRRHVISSAAKRSREISLFYGMGRVGAGDLSTQSINIDGPTDHLNAAQHRSR